MSAQGLSDENSPVDVGPAGTGDVEQAAQSEIDWQQRYIDTQDSYTRGQQELAEFRRQNELYQKLVATDDSETQREIAAQLGYRIDQEEESEFDEDEDPIGYIDDRLSRLEGAQQQAVQDQEQAEWAAEVRTIVDERLGQLDLHKDDQDMVLAYAINALPVTEEGLPDIEQAHQVFQAREVERQKAWAQTKRAPRISPNGQAGTEVPNLDDRQQRQDFMVRRLQDNEAQF